FAGKRNPDYYFRGQPYVDGFESIRVADSSTFVNAFRTGDANLLASGVTIQQSEDIKKTVPGVNVIYIPNDRGTTELMLNMTLDIFKDVRVRQAISKAIDRQAIIDTVWLGRGAFTP